MLNGFGRLKNASSTLGGVEIDADTTIAIDHDRRVLRLAAFKRVLDCLEENCEFGHDLVPGRVQDAMVPINCTVKG